MADPWLKFYPSDWRSDPRLRLCSRAARGTWIDMLSIMHEAEPYGELRVNGIALDARGLAKLLGEQPADIESDLAELEANGVFSRRKNGVIYSRRMEKDENRRRKMRENGKKGGNPTLLKQTTIEALDNQEDKTTEARSQKPEAREDASASSKARATKHLLPADWEPKDSTFEKARTDWGYSEADVRERVAALFEWSHGKGERRLDWDLVLLGALRRDAQRATGPPRHQQRSIWADMATGNFSDDTDNEQQALPAYQ